MDTERQNALAQLDNATLDELEAALDADMEEALADVEFQKEERDKIGNPISLSQTVMNVVWDQFVVQVGAVAGEEFIRENRGMTLDLRDSAHIQTTDNFADGKIATHNSHIDYQQRYDDWQANFQRNEDGTIKKRFDRRANRELEVLNKGARDYIDKNRPSGSGSIHKDHMVSAAEVIRDPEAAAHLSRDEHSAFANCEKNLKDLDGAANESKKDLRMDEWLKSERDGKRPAERFNINEEELRESDRIAREEYEKVKTEGKQRSDETGKKSQREEAARMGKSALKGVAMGLIVALLKTIFQKFAVWLKSKGKSFSSFIAEIKAAVKEFFSNLKTHLKIATQSSVASLASMILGPIARILQKAWVFIKQGYGSLKEAIAYIRNPANKKKPLSIMMMEVGKIIIAGLSAAGAIALGGVIESGLSSIPGFAFNIPGLGSLASILGVFFGAIISGIIGGLALNLIDRWIAKKQKAIKTGEIVESNNRVLALQSKKIAVSEIRLENTKIATAVGIVARHQEAADLAAASFDQITDNNSEIVANDEEINDDSYRRDITPSRNDSALNDLIADIDSI